MCVFSWFGVLGDVSSDVYAEVIIIGRIIEERDVSAIHATLFPRKMERDSYVKCATSYTYFSTK